MRSENILNCVAHLSNFDFSFDEGITISNLINRLVNKEEESLGFYREVGNICEVCMTESRMCRVCDFIGQYSKLLPNSMPIYKMTYHIFNCHFFGKKYYFCSFLILDQKKNEHLIHILT